MKNLCKGFMEMIKGKFQNEKSDEMKFSAIKGSLIMKRLLFDFLRSLKLSINLYQQSYLESEGKTEVNMCIILLPLIIVGKKVLGGTKRGVKNERVRKNLLKNLTTQRFRH